MELKAERAESSMNSDHPRSSTLAREVDPETNALMEEDRLEVLDKEIKSAEQEEEMAMVCCSFSLLELADYMLSLARPLPYNRAGAGIAGSGSVLGSIH